MNKAKVGFANEMSTQSLGNNGLGMNECMKFGMTWGCQPDCPVFERGECERQEEQAEIFAEEESNTLLSRRTRSGSTGS